MATTKEECVICGLLEKAGTVPHDVQIVMAFSFGRTASKRTDREPPMCTQHELLDSAMSALVGTAIDQHERTGSPSEGSGDE